MNNFNNTIEYKHKCRLISGIRDISLCEQDLEMAYIVIHKLSSGKTLLGLSFVVNEGLSIDDQGNKSSRFINHNFSNFENIDYLNVKTQYGQEIHIFNPKLKFSYFTGRHFSDLCGSHIIYYTYDFCFNDEPHITREKVNIDNNDIKEFNEIENKYNKSMDILDINTSLRDIKHTISELVHKPLQKTIGYDILLWGFLYALVYHFLIQLF